MYIKIYFADKPVFLCDEIDSELNSYLHHPDTIFIDEVSTPAIKSLLHEIEKKDFHAGILWGKDLNTLQKLFWKNFTIIHASGGVVINEKNEILFIFRRGKWDLPKGKTDAGETPEDCALREISEETGLKNLKIVKMLFPTFHTYVDFGKHILKQTDWFLIQGSSKEILVPQTSEDIFEAVWVSQEKINVYLENTYASVKEVLHKSFEVK